MRLWKFLCAAALASASAALCQDVSGVWQGSLEAGRTLRLELVITKADGGFQGKLYSIDQGAGGLATGKIVVGDGSMKVPVPLIEATFEGKLSQDGNSVVGTWTQGGGKSLPLTLAHVKAEEAWPLPKPVANIPMMDPKADPAFDVATVKPSEPGSPGQFIRVNGREFSTHNVSLQELMAFSYEVHPKQLVGLPDWASSEKWDIMGKPDTEGRPTDKQWKTMINKLLVERFGLKFHQDKKELPVFALSVAKTGSKMTKSDGDPNGLPGFSGGRAGRLSARNTSMAFFAQVLQSNMVDRPVLDKTGLEGHYDFVLRFTPDDASQAAAAATAASAEEAAPSLYTAMQEQLGLKLEPVKAPADVMVIDHVEKPSAN